MHNPAILITAKEIAEFVWKKLGLDADETIEEMDQSVFEAKVVAIIRLHFGEG